MTDDVKIETVFRVRNSRTGGTTIHNTIEEANAQLRNAVFEAELMRLLANRVEANSVRMLLAQPDKFVAVLAQFKAGYDEPIKGGVDVQENYEGKYGGVTVKIYDSAVPAHVKRRGTEDIAAIEVATRDDAVAGAGVSPSVEEPAILCSGCGRGDGTHAPKCPAAHGGGAVFGA